jgi:hypothetical protein
MSEVRINPKWIAMLMLVEAMPMFIRSMMVRSQLPPPQPHPTRTHALWTHDRQCRKIYIGGLLTGC